MIESQVNKFLFETTNLLINFVVQQNRKILFFEEMQVEDRVNEENVSLVVVYLKKFYEDVYKVVRVTVNKNQIIQEIQQKNSTKNFVEKFSQQDKLYSYLDVQRRDKSKHVQLIKQPSEQPKLDLGRLLFCFTVSQWHYVAMFLLVVYHFRNQGVVAVFLPLAIFGYGLPEEIYPQKYLWTACSAFVGLMTVAKYLMLLVPFHFLTTVFGSDTSVLFELVLLVVLLVQINLLKAQGLFNTTLGEIETIYTSILRVLPITSTPSTSTS